MAGPTPTIVLVHGGFEDASGYAGVIERLEADGYPVVAPGNPLRSLSGDAETLRIRIAAIDGPLVLVGHAYGGAVITQASATLDSVIGLVYLAAYGLEIGESCRDVQEEHPSTGFATGLRSTPYDAPGAPDGPDLFVDGSRFRDLLCGDAAEPQARVMAVTQRPLSAFALDQEAASKGWDVTPSWFLVSERDRAISPQAQRFMAKRMRAVTESIDASHTAFVAYPERVAAFIRRAALHFVAALPTV